MLEIASERLADGDPRTSQKVYRLKPRRAGPGILHPAGETSTEHARCCKA
jgi:hypothetical protein